MSGEYTPESEHCGTAYEGVGDGVGHPAPGAGLEQLGGLDLSQVGELLRGLDFGGDLPAVDVPEPGAHDTAPVEWELGEGVSEEIAEQAAGHGVDPTELIAQDNDLDGTPDYYYTENGDNYVTFSAFDQDQDGTLEYVSTDTDADGSFDYTDFDTDGDGAPDTTITYP